MDIIVPVKKFSEAKTRLAGILLPAERESLAELLAVTVFERLSRVRTVRRVIVASSEPSITNLAARFGFDVLADDPQAPGLNAAIERAIRHALGVGAIDVGVVFSDLPLFKSDEFEKIVDLHCNGVPRQATLVLDRFGAGTNVRLCRPGDLLPSLYGRNSAAEYRKAAAANAAEIRVIASDRLSHDLDQPGDIEAVLDPRCRQALPPALRAMFNVWVDRDIRQRQSRCA